MQLMQWVRCDHGRLLKLVWTCLEPIPTMTLDHISVFCLVSCCIDLGYGWFCHIFEAAEDLINLTESQETNYHSVFATSSPNKTSSPTDSSPKDWKMAGMSYVNDSLLKVKERGQFTTREKVKQNRLMAMKKTTCLTPKDEVLHTSELLTLWQDGNYY